jgi:Tfp pilus assembly protein PilX
MSRRTMRTVVTLARRGRVALAAVACAATLGGCAGLLGRAPEDRVVTVNLAVSRSEAVRRTLQAFRDEGYQLKETLTSGTEPETEPFRHGDADAVFRATVESAGRNASRVTLRGTYRKRELGGLVHGREQEVKRSDDPLEKELWARLDNLGVAIRRAARP